MAWYDFAVDAWQRLCHMLRVMGRHFVLTIVLIEHLLQAFVFGGGSAGLVGLPILFLLRQYGTLTAARMQVLKTIAVSPWALKPLFGMLSDTLYVGGYKRMPYIFATLLMAIVSCFVIAVYWPLGPELDTLCFFVIILQIAVGDLLIESGYIEKTRDHPDIKTDLVAFVDVGGYPWQMAAILCSGLLLTYVTQFQYIYLLAIPPFLVTLYPIYANWIAEQEYVHQTPHLTDAEALDDNTLCNLLPCARYYKRAQVERGEAAEPTPLIGLDYQLPGRHWRVFLLAAIVGLISLGTSLVGLATSNTLVLFVLSVVGAPLMMVCFGLLVDRQTAKLQVFVLVQNMFSVSLGSAEFFFLTDTASQFPEGPHFSNFFVVTVMGLVAALLGMLGGALYQIFMTGWNYRRVLVVANLANVFFSGLSIVFFKRWNLALGIPDELFVVGAEALQVITNAWASLPFKVMMLQMCPSEIAATSYALLAGSSNLGGALSQYQGAFLLDVLGIKPTGAPNESAQFQNLWIAIVVNMALPLVPLLLIPWLIPDVDQKTSLLMSGHQSVEADAEPLELQELPMSESEEEIRLGEMLK